MTCKYFDCGWCYAPSEISTSATPNKKCLNPDACLYLKSQMTNQTPCNHRTPPKYNVEYLDDKMVIVNGIQYQRVEGQKPQTLYEIIREWNDNEYCPTCEELVNTIESEWLPKIGDIQPPLYADGWNDCIKHLKENLK
jgi:hypothetical protein